MTTDLDDLVRSTLAERADRAPVPGAVLTRLQTGSGRRRRRARGLAVAGVAAAVAVGAALGITILGTPDPGEPPATAPPHGQGSQPAAVSGHRAVMEAAGWELRYANDDADIGSLGYRRPGAAEVPFQHEKVPENGTVVKGTYPPMLDIKWMRTRLREESLDFANLSRPAGTAPSDGEAIDVLGTEARLWSHDPNAQGAVEHIVILPVRGGWFLEVHGLGMDLGEFRSLLATVRWVDQAGLDAALPDRFLTSAERPAAIARMHVGIPLPAGYDPDAVTSGEPERYHLASDVVDGVVCAWIERWRQARGDGDQAAIDEAVTALEGSDAWPVVERRLAGTDHGWGLTDAVSKVSAGKDPSEFAEFTCGS